MAERPVKIPFPLPTSPTVDGVEVGVKESTERWSEVTLEDGSILRIKPSPVSATRIIGLYDPEGNPMYALKAHQMMNVQSAPEHLKQRPAAQKVQ